MTESHRAHAKCWQGDHYEHVCQNPSGRACIERGCDAPAGTGWGPHWCPEHDAERLDRIGASLDSIARSFDA